MALNFMGLGFTFGAKDAGLTAKQEEISKGFETMFAHMEKLGKAADVADTGKVVPAGSEDQVNKMSDAVGALSEKLGDELPEASREGTEQFHRDAGSMESDQRRIGGGFNFIRDAMEKLNTIARQNKLQTFIQAISLSKLNDIAGSLGEIGSQGMNLTTSFEATMVASAKSARQMGANFGYTGKVLSKFTSKAAGMSIALNIGAEEAALSLRAWTESADELGAMGFKSAKEVAKFSSAFGVSADLLRNSGRRMRKEFKMGDEQINQLIGSWTKMGQETGDVGKALNEMPQLLDQLSRSASTMGQKLDPQELADYGAGMAALAAGFFQVYEDADKAREAAFTISETMISAKEDFHSMFAGTKDDISGFHKALGIATGDIGKAFKTMTQGPDQFIAGVAGMVQQAKRADKDIDFRMLRGQLESVFGADKAAQLVNFFRVADDSILGMMKDVKKAPADLGKMAKEGFRSGRTLAESFELTKDRFIVSFRAISRTHAREFVKETGKEFGKFTKRLKELSAKGGPMGMLVDKMSEMHQLGALALIPKTLRPMATVFGEMASQLTPAATAMGALGFRLKMLANPFLLVAAAAGGLYALFRSNKKTIENASTAYAQQEKTLKKLNKSLSRRRKGTLAYQKVAEKIEELETRMADTRKYVQVSKNYKMQTEAVKTLQDRLGKYNKDSEKGKKIAAQLEQAEKKLAKTRELIAGEARQKTIAQIESAIQNAIVKIGLVGKALFEKMKEWWPLVEDFIIGMWDSLILGVDPTKGGKDPATQWGLKLGAALRHGLRVAADAVVKYFKGWWSNIAAIWSDDSTTFLDKVKETVKGSAGLIIGAFALAKFTPVFGVLKTLAGVIGGPLLKAVNLFKISMITALGPVGLVVTALAGLATLLHFFPQYFDDIEAKVGQIAEKIGYYVAKGMEILLKVVVLTLKQLPDIFVKFFKLSIAAVFGVLDGLKRYLQEEFPRAFDVIEGLFVALKVVAVAVITAIFFHYTVKLAEFMIKWVKDHYIRLKGWLLEKKKAIFASVKTAAAWVKSIAEMSWKFLKFVGETVWGFAKIVAKGVRAAAIFAKKFLWAFASIVVEILATTVVLLAQFAMWAAAGVAAAIPVLVAWAPFILLAAAIAGAVYGIIKAWGSITEFFGLLWDGVKAIFKGVWDALTFIVLNPIKALKAAWAAITGFFSGLWDGIKSVTKKAWDFIKDTLLAVPRALKAAWKGIKGFFKGAWNGLKSAAKSVWGGIKSIFSGGGSSLIATLKKKMPEMVRQLEKTGKAAKKEGPKISNAFARAAVDSVKEMKKVAEAAQINAPKAVLPYVDAKNRMIQAQKDTAKGAENAAPRIGRAHARAAEKSIGASAVGVKAIKLHTKAMKTHVDVANALVYPKMDTEAGKLAKAYREAGKRADALADAGRGGTEAYKEAVKVESEARKAFKAGAKMDMFLFEQLEKSIRGRLNLSAEHGITPHMEALKYLQTTEMDTLKVLEGQRDQEALLQIQAGQRALQQLAAGEITREQYEKTLRTIEDATDSSQTMFKDTAMYLANMPYYFEQSSEDIQKDAAAFANAVAIIATKEFGNMTRNFTSLSEEQRTHLNKMRDTMIASAKTRLGQFLETTNKTGEELKAALGDLNKNAQEELNSLFADAERLNKEAVGKVPAEAQRAWEQVMGKHEEKIGEMAKSTSIAASKTAAEIEKVSGIGGKDAMEMAQKVAKINTKRFKANIKVIREEFFELLAMMREINEGVIGLGPNVEKSFPKASAAVDKFAKKLMPWFEEGGSKNLSKLVDNTFKRIIALVPKFQTDLLKPIDKLFNHIETRTKNVFKTLTEDLKNTARALRGIAVLSRGIAMGREEDEVTGATLKRPAKVKTFKAELSAERQLFEATHEPDWYTQSYKYYAEAMSASLHAISMSMGNTGAEEGGRRSTTAAPAPTEPYFPNMY